MRYFLDISYVGTAFHGWQRQPNAISVQQCIEDSLSIILRKNCEITGAGRTDTGVHALKMYAHFDSEPIEDPVHFLSSLNKLIGNDISIHNLLPVKPDAHARFDALSRSYLYRISLFKDPFDFNFSHRIDFLPDIERMNEAASILLHTSDFTSFAKLHSDSVTNICDVTFAKWEYDEIQKKLLFRITANRFLRNMVRAVVGTLIDVGRHKLDISDFVNIIESKNRSSAGMSMPAKGLFLENITYHKEIFQL